MRKIWDTGNTQNWTEFYKFLLPAKINEFYNEVRGSLVLCVLGSNIMLVLVSG